MKQTYYLILPSLNEKLALKSGKMFCYDTQAISQAAFTYIRKPQKTYNGKSIAIKPYQIAVAWYTKWWKLHYVVRQYTASYQKHKTLYSFFSCCAEDLFFFIWIRVFKSILSFVAYEMMIWPSGSIKEKTSAHNAAIKNRQGCLSHHHHGILANKHSFSSQ